MNLYSSPYQMSWRVCITPPLDLVMHHEGETQSTLHNQLCTLVTHRTRLTLQHFAKTRSKTPARLLQLLHLNMRVAEVIDRALEVGVPEDPQRLGVVQSLGLTGHVRLGSNQIGR